MKPPRISDAEFVRRWNAATSIAALAAELGRSYQACSQRRLWLRSKGYQLKGYTRGKTATPVRTRIDRRLIADPGGCTLWSGWLDKNGIPCVKDRQGQLSVGRFLWEELHGPIPPAQFLIRCKRDARCVCPGHAFLATGGHAKLTLNQTAELIRRGLAGEGLETLTIEFGLDRSHIGRLIRQARRAQRSGDVV
jgi:hypothetical protein